MADTPRYCRSCGYDLRGVDHSCPECGRLFSADDPRTTRSRPKAFWLHRRAVVVASLFGLMWVSVFMRLPVWPFLLPVVAVVAIAGRRWIGLAMVLVVNPLVWVVFSATMQYAAESPGLSPGGPGVATHFQNYGRNLHPVTRLRFPSGHGSYYGDEWTYAIPRNLTLLTLTRLLGPPPNAYRGSYPTHAQAKATLVNADAVPVWNLTYTGNHMIELPQESISIAASQGWAILEESAFRDVWFPLDEEKVVSRYGPLRAAIFGPDCVLLEVPALLDPLTGQPTSQNRGIFLIDRNTGQAFAVYTTGNAEVDWRSLQWGWPK